MISTHKAWERRKAGVFTRMRGCEDARMRWGAPDEHCRRVRPPSRT